jgi:hypothetical protein
MVLIFGTEKKFNELSKIVQTRSGKKGGAGLISLILKQLKDDQHYDEFKTNIKNSRSQNLP